jgi:hypothetical protein
MVRINTPYSRKLNSRVLSEKKKKNERATKGIKQRSET